MGKCTWRKFLSLVAAVLALSDLSKNAANANLQDLAPNIVPLLQNTDLADFLLKELSSFPLNLGNYSKLSDLADSFQSLQLSISKGGDVTIRNKTVGGKCLQDFYTTSSALAGRKEWAIRIFDAYGKPGAGLYDGNINWLGSYDECLNVQVPSTTEQKSNFETQYCLLSFPMPKALQAPQTAFGALKIKWGTCLPNSCSSTDVKNLLELGMLTFNFFSRQGTNESAPSEGVDVDCKPRSIPYDTSAIVMLCILATIGFVILVATLYDVKLKIQESYKPSEVSKESKQQNGEIYKINGTDLKSEEKNGLHEIKVETPVTSSGDKKPKSHSVLARVLLCFSVYTNGKKLLSTSVGAGNLSAVNGIRFLSMSWVVIGHTFMDYFTTGTNAGEFYPRLVNKWSYTVLTNGMVSVDSFFALSGLLVSYLFFKDMARNSGRINWFMFYFHRFWRLTPAYMLCIGIVATLTKYIVSGPLAPASDLEPTCKTDWWANMLYINNFVGHLRCYGVAWYLANDMQFFVVSPLFMVPLYYSKVIGLALCGAGILGSIIATWIITAHYDVTMDVFAVAKNTDKYMEYYYIKPWCRIGPYLVGIMVGYILYKTKSKCHIKKSVCAAVWIIATTVACAVLYGTSDHKPDTPKIVASFYNAVHRTLWGACVCWVVFACATGNGGIVNKLMSWRVYVPLGRLTYCTYLTHIYVLWGFTTHIRALYYYTEAIMVLYSMGALVLCLAFGFATSLAFESPMMGLEKVIFRRTQVKKEPKDKKAISTSL